MAISNSANILAMLKVYYKDGVENLMFRNSPVVKEIKKEHVEGKSQNFCAMYGRGGAVGADFLKAQANAKETAKAKEFQVTPGQLFSVYTMNAKEVQASKTNRGAYMKIAGDKMFAASESYRKTLALAFYGRGYGEICKSGYTSAITAKTPFKLTLPSHAIMAIDIGTKLALKAKVDDASEKAILEVTEINGNEVTVNPEGSSSSNLTTDVLCLDGSMDGGTPILPMGLGGWLPTVGKRTGVAWGNYIKADFFGVKRNVAADRLAGAFYDGKSDDKKSLSLQKLIQRCRRQGSQADLIIMNDEDFLEFSNEIEATNTFFTQTSTTAKKNATTGMSKLAAAFSTNYIENIYDDPYCPKGVFYVLDKAYVELWTYTNVDKVNDGVSGNAAGKPDVMEAGAEMATKPSGLIIDDYINIQPGTATTDGPAIDITLQMYGSFVVKNPSVCGVGLFKGADLIEA